jgi:hypothetical protein
MEFQYLSDMNARVILSAFQMSPEELPGWSYLSRGTNSQSLSEGNNEYKLEAARDVGIRPLLSQIEDFLNVSILPLFDPVLGEACALKLVGLDAETAEKESVRIQQDMPVHMTYDEVLEKVEKRAVGKRMGGEFPINPQFQAILDKYITVGEILEFFFDREGASKDPRWNYVRDPFYQAQQQMLMQQQQMAQQQQMQAQQAAQGPSGPPPDDGGGQGGGQPAPEGSPGPGNEPAMTEKQKTAAVEEASASPSGPPAEDLTRSIDQALGLLSKAEKQLPASKRKILAKQKTLLSEFMTGWEQDLEEAKNSIIDAVKKTKPGS